jgi:hypothetical protein
VISTFDSEYAILGPIPSQFVTIFQKGLSTNPQILSTSLGLKMDRIRWKFHHPVAGSISAETRVDRGKIQTRDWTLYDEEDEPFFTPNLYIFTISHTPNHTHL